MRFKVITSYKQLIQIIIFYQTYNNILFYKNNFIIYNLSILYFKELKTTNYISIIFLIGDNNILDTIYNKTFFFNLVFKKAKNCIFLN